MEFSRPHACTAAYSGSLRLTSQKLSDDAAFMSKAIILREFWNFLRVRKKFWLAPIVVVLVLLSLLIVLTQGSALAPFVYALF